MTSPNNRQDSGRTIIPAVRASNHWQDRAACKTADAEAIFFPVSPNAATIQAAKEICYGCPVIEDCKRFALERREPHGVWGGMSEYERRVVGTQKEPRPQKILRTQRAEWDAAVAEHGNNDKAIAQALGTDTRTVWKVQRLLLDDTQALDEAADELPATSSATAYSESLVARFLAGESVILGQVERRMVVVHFMEWSSLSPEQIGERLGVSGKAVLRQWERVQARARREGRPVPVRRVPREERSELKQIQMGEAA